MRTNGFLAGMLTGAALGAVVVLAMSRRTREPVMDAANGAGDRTGTMWRSDDNSVKEVLPGDVQ